jgi:predicted Zn-dependent protease with MMP-like domain
MANSKRESIIKRINLLKERTTSNGCTESEAMVAAEAISKLLQEYDLSMTEVEVKSQEFIKDEINIDGKTKKPIHDLITSIGYFTDTKVYYTKRMSNYVYNFFGAKKDVEFAGYLLDLLSHAMDNEYAKYQKTSEYKMIGGKVARGSFYKGMVIRLRQRLREMKDNMSKESQESGLVLYNKMAITEQMFKENNPSLRLKTSTSRMTISDKTAFNSGKDAANRVNITSGLGGRKVSESMRLNA